MGTILPSETPSTINHQKTGEDKPPKTPKESQKEIQLEHHQVNPTNDHEHRRDSPKLHIKESPKLPVHHNNSPKWNEHPKETPKKEPEHHI